VEASRLDNKKELIKYLFTRKVRHLARNFSELVL